MSVQDEHGVSRNSKIVDGQRVEQLRCLNLGRGGFRGADLRQAVRDIEDENDEEAIGGSLDLEVAEEGVRTEEVERLVNHIVLFRVGCVAYQSNERRT